MESTWAPDIITVSAERNAFSTPNHLSQTTGRAVAVVVTYNRKILLLQCINALLSQTISCDIVLVDNASTDGTVEALRESGLLANERLHFLSLKENLGGAAGFSRGLQYAMNKGWEWLWLMDDDAMPEPDALEKLCISGIAPSSVYGSVAVFHDNGQKKLCSPAGAVHRKNEGYIEYLDLLSPVEEVAGIPFLGFFIHRSMVERIGLPRDDFFIYWDDLEYSERVKKHGGKLMLVRDSVIVHPVPQITTFRYGPLKIAYRSLPPWKIYYEVRNKIITAKEYMGFSLWSKTLPGVIFRLVFSLCKEKNRAGYLKAFAKGISDGLVGRTEKRFLPP
jgi:rhamnopyranosyl-N-acetylglucosaminyl-diphospho-decaprenol beta-1,3/1,4-galactofuranosyltransferase